jgi:hypothetical protein
MPSLKYYFFLLCCAFSALASGKEDKLDYAVSNIPEDLKTGASAVIRNYQTQVRILEPGKAKISSVIAITILKSESNFNRVYQDIYDNYSKIDLLEGYLYDANGIFIKNVRGNEAIDRSYSSENDFINDVRIKIIELTGSSLPCTVEFKEEKIFKGYIALPGWFPLRTFGMSLEKAEFNVIYPSEFDIKYLARNFSETVPRKSKVKNDEILSWSLEHFPAISNESYLPDKKFILPYILLTSTKFCLGDFKGDLSSWESFGKFFFDLNKNKDLFQKEKKLLFYNCFSSETNKKLIVEKLYYYLQDNTRYVSVQLGIGGWQSYDADYVNRNKIGDCKALTTYMKAMLQCAGINSFQVIVNAGEPDDPLIDNFPYNFFNHVVLMVPLEKDTMWLECTSTTSPAGYLGTFTEGHTGLLISDSVSCLIQLPASSVDDNYIDIKNNIAVSKDLSVSVNTSIEAHGSMQERVRFLMQYGNEDDIKQWIKSLFRDDVGKIDFLKLEKVSRQDATIKLSYQVNLPHFLSRAGNDYILDINTITKIRKVPEEIDVRRYAIRNESAFLIRDSSTYNFPSDLSIMLSKNDSTYISADFGSYKFIVHHSKENNTLNYLYEFRLKRFNFPNDHYKDLRKFFLDVMEADRQRIVLRNSN